MAIGDLVKHERKRYRDTYTGAWVTRLTSPDTLHHHPYFYYKMMTEDGRFLIHAREHGHSRQLYRMDLQEGVSMQLTEGPGIQDFSCTLTRDDRSLYYCRNSRIVKLDLGSGREETIYESPEGWISNANPGVSSDDRYIVVVEMKESDQVHGKGDWSTFEPQWAARPHCRIVYIDAERKESRVAYEEPHCWLGHPQIRPGGSGTILFCHEGPWYRIDARLWLVNADGSGHRCARPHTDGELVTHEYWLNDGSRIAFVHRDKDGKNGTIRLLDPVTLQEEVLMECSRYCHFISNRNLTRIVGDGQPADEHFIYLVDVAARREAKLCSHSTSWKPHGNTQDSHPHPAFSPDGSFVIFTSDMEGKPAIYQVETT